MGYFWFVIGLGVAVSNMLFDSWLMEFIMHDHHRKSHYVPPIEEEFDHHVPV